MAINMAFDCGEKYYIMINNHSHTYIYKQYVCMAGVIVHGFVGKQLIAVIVEFDDTTSLRTVDSRTDAPGESSRPGHCGMHPIIDLP